jgi:hypothetical protein
MVDVFNPQIVFFNSAHCEANQFHVAFLEFILVLGKFCNLGGANRSEVAWMRK